MVVIQLREFPYAAERERINAFLRYQVAGIAPLVYVGYPDGLEISLEQYRERVRKGEQLPPAMIAEIRPQGDPLVLAAPLSDGESIRVGIALCETIEAWLAGRAPSEGLTPETVYIAGDRGDRYYAGATPRVYLFDGRGGYEPSFSDERYGGPLSGPMELAPTDATFMVAQLIWFAASGEHVYGPGDGMRAMEEDRKRPFTGNPEIGALLERVLVFDEDKRIDVHALRAGLVELAQRWGVEMPPFPPPGLAD